MTWDGPYQFALSLIEQRPYFYLSRFHSYLLWLPTVIASRWTTDFQLLQMLYGLPFCLAPAVGFGLSWWVAHRHAPKLLLWALFGIAVAPLPGQVFMINDSIFQQHLFWPVLLGALCPISRGKWWVLAILALLQLSHPIGIGLCAGAAVAAAYVGRQQDEHGARFMATAAWLGLISVAGVVKLFVFPDSYAASEASIVKLLVLFWQGVAGWPLLALTLFLWGAWLVIRSRKTGAGGEIDWAPIVWCGAGALVLLFWAADPHRWVKALDYRRWLVPLTLPFFVAAFLQRPRSSGRSASAQLHNGLAILLAIVWVGVLGLQSAGWKGLVDGLAAQVRSHREPLLPAESLAWTAGTALEHWGTSALVITLQGPQPHTLLLQEKELPLLLQQPPSIPLVAHHPINPEPGAAGWYEFRPVVAEIRDFVRPANHAPPMHSSPGVSDPRLPSVAEAAGEEAAQTRLKR